MKLSMLLLAVIAQLSLSAFAQGPESINADKLYISNGVCRISFSPSIEELIRQTRFVDNIRQSMQLDSRVYQQKSLRNSLTDADVEALKTKGYYVASEDAYHGDFALVGTTQCWTYSAVPKFFGKEDYCEANLDLIQIISGNASPNPAVKSMNRCDDGYGGSCFVVSIVEGSKRSGKVRSSYNSGPKKTAREAISEAISSLPDCTHASFR